MEYGVLGRVLQHSWSPQLHGMLADYDYQLIPKETPELAREFLLNKEYKGVNVTIPYKGLAFEVCDQVDEGARLTGAVNTVVNRNGRLYGYNTDIAGFKALAQRAGVEFRGRDVLILGTGGTAHTALAVVKAAGASEVHFVSRTPKEGQLSYREAEARRSVQVIVNTTPVGMHPNSGERSIDPALFPNLEAVLDVVYNPLRTRLVSEAAELGAKSMGGLFMLVEQARAASEKFTGGVIPPQKADEVYRRLVMQCSNICLIGMPSCGKSSIGRKLARRMGRPFVDADRALEEDEGCSVAVMFKMWGEPGFRQRESRCIAKIAEGSGQVIACGGGGVEREENIRALRRNGVLVFIDRPVSGLRVGGRRPLSTSVEALRRMEKRRRPLYKAAADLRVANTGGLFREAMLRVEEELYAYFGVERPKPQSSGPA